MMRRNGMVSLVILSVVLILALGSCDPYGKYKKEEKASIQGFLSNNPSLSFELRPSGLYFLQIKAGTGPIATIHDTAYVKYTGKFLDGNVFDTNIGKPDTLSFPVAEGWMISGFDEAVTLMNVGTKVLLLVPSSLAYGPSGYYLIPSFTPLLFDIELVKLVSASEK